MKRNNILFMIILFSICCEKGGINNEYVDIFESNNTILSIGADEENTEAKAYQWILNYCIDREGNIYVADPRDLTVDKYDNQGKYLYSYGKKGQGPGEFSNQIESFAADSNGNFIAYTWQRNSLIIFYKDGKDIKEIKLSDEFRKTIIRTIKIDLNNNMYILSYSKEKGYILGKYDIEKARYDVFHVDNKRIRPPFVDLLPDFDFDTSGNIYITDSIDYKIYKYSQTGRLLDFFYKKMEKNKIVENDFNYLVDNRIIKIPGYQNAWKKLKGLSGFFPNIFGINIDANRIYIWTSNQDKEKKYKIEIFDQKFNPICASSYYNYLPKNYAVIRNNKFHIVNIENSDPEIKKEIGRFGMFKSPYKIEVYKISERIIY